MKRIVILLSLVPLVLLLAVGCQKKPAEDQMFNEAKKFQEESKYSEAVASYEKLVQVHPRGKYAPQSQFMVGFILANEIKDLKRAEAAYQAFLDKYSSSADSGMVASAQWELKNLGKDINEIQDLSGIMQQDTVAVADSAKAKP
jgi:outer membrane protein assembly factor BamD (BamD/ComL family)